MKNADMPAMPQSFAMNEYECGTASSHMENEENYIGLTKREMIAMSAMQGLSGANVDTLKIYLNATGEEDIGAMIAKMSVEYADALLKQLEK